MKFWQTNRLLSLSQLEHTIVAICLASPDEARLAWQSWVATLPRTLPAGGAYYEHHLRELMPFIGWRSQVLNLDGPDWLLSRLKTAVLLEECRVGAVRQTYQQILSLSSIQQGQPLVIGGLAIAETVYPAAVCRHTSHIQLLTSTSASRNDVSRDLVKLGYRPVLARWPIRTLDHLRGRYMSFRHPSSLSIRIDFGQRNGMNHEKLLMQSPAININGAFSIRGLPAQELFQHITHEFFARKAQKSLLGMIDAAFLYRSEIVKNTHYSPSNKKENNIINLINAASHWKL